MREYELDQLKDAGVPPEELELHTAVREHVMGFFQGVDLDQDGEYTSGQFSVSVETLSWDRTNDPAYRVATASLHGIEVARYRKYFDPERVNGVEKGYDLFGKFYTGKSFLSSPAHINLVKGVNGETSLSYWPEDFPGESELRTWIQAWSE